MTRHPIPEAALKKHIAILGMNGSGKTSVAKSEIIEPALEAGERVCNIDPTGVGWGLRLSATGKRKGFAIYIVGGEHADFPLFKRDGKAWGEIVGTSSDSFIFDTSAMTVTDRSVWWTDFAETLLRLNRGPLKLVIDEAHLFAPQGGAKGGGATPDMLHATNNLLSLGRSKGLRITMISQRPAKLHKDSLTQAHTLIAMSLMAPHDRQAVSDWIADQADMARGKEIVASLPSLDPGEGWLWAPREKVLERVKFARPKTFDSSSAPDDGDSAGPSLPPINPDAIKSKLETVAKETIANDPAKLRAEVARLKAELAKAPVSMSPSGPRREDAATIKSLRSALEATMKFIVQITADGFIDNEGKGLEPGAIETALKGAVDQISKMVERKLEHRNTEFEKLRKDAERLISKLKPLLDSDVEISLDVKHNAPFTVVESVPRPASRPSIPRPNSRAPSEGLNGPEQRILDAVAWWKAAGVDQPSKVQVAAVARYSPNGGAFNNPLGGLRSKGLINNLSLTPEGEAIANGPESSPDTAELHARVMAILDGPQKRILAPLLECYPDSMAKADLAQAAEYSPDGGAFNNPLGSLRSLGLIDYPQRGVVVAQPILFV